MVKVFFDTETTGTDHRKHSVIQLSGLIEVDGEVVDDFDYLIKPHPKARIEPEALSVNGKTLEEIMEYPDMKTVLKAFKKKMAKYVDRYDKTNKAYLVGFNNRAFDDFFLRMLFELCGDRFMGSLFWVDTLDVLCLASEYLLERRPQMPSFKLKRVAMELGIEVDKSKLHDAIYGVELTRKIYRIVTRREMEPSDNLF